MRVGQDAGMTPVGHAEYREGVMPLVMMIVIVKKEVCGVA